VHGEPTLKSAWINPINLADVLTAVGDRKTVLLYPVGSAEKAGRRKQEPKGDSTPDQAEKEKDPQGS
jgi:hypothetical protein